jgi:two-component system, NtrC family, sensor histidine kinase HydH
MSPLCRRVSQRVSQPVDASARICHAPAHMGTWTLPGPTSGKVLLRQFAILGLVVIGLIALVLSLTVSSVLRRDLLDREWVTTADYVRAQVLAHLTPDVLATPDTDEATERFERFFQQVATMPEVFRVKVYAADGTVRWSDDAQLVGRRFPDNPHLSGALAGQTVVNMTSGAGKTENVGERSVFARVVEVYVPITFPQASRVAGVVELYKMPRQVFESIRRSQLTAVGTVLTCSLLLYLSLFWIVRRAAHRIDEQHRSLESRGLELARANDELRAVQGQLLEAERLAAIGEVVTAVAHGIRNPLANIRAAAQVAGLGSRDAGPAAPTARHLTSIMAEVDRLEGRLKELLQFVRPAVLVDLNLIVREAAHMVAGRMATARISLTQALAPRLPSVSGNAMLLEQVVLSLLANAVEAIPNGDGRIHVVTDTTATDAGAPAVFVEVSDTGVGIPSEGMAKLFTPFYTTKAQGTGLGLAIAKKFTEAHGGTITLSSRPGTGATFRVTLPARTEV